MSNLQSRWRDHRRRAIAGGLEHLVEEAGEHPPVLSARVPFRRRDVLAARTELIELATALRDNPAPHPDGLAAANRLLTSSNSPVYEPLGADALRAAAREARLLIK